MPQTLEDWVELGPWLNTVYALLALGVVLRVLVYGWYDLKLQARLGFLSIMLFCLAVGYGSYETEYMPGWYLRVPIAGAACLMAAAAVSVPRLLERRDGVRRH